MRKYLALFLWIGCWNLPIEGMGKYAPNGKEEVMVQDSLVKPKRSLEGQPYLVVDANPALGGFYRYRYFEGDRFKFRSIDQPGKQKVTLYTLADSSFQHVTYSEGARALNYHQVDFASIRKVYTSRRIPFITEGAFLLPLAGVIYLLADFVNPGIDGQRWNTSSGTAAVSTGMIVTGGLFYKLSFKTVRMNNRNRLYLLRTY